MYTQAIGDLEIWHVPYPVIQLGPERFRLECPYLAEKLQVPERWEGYRYYLPTMDGAVYVQADDRGVVFDGVDSLDRLAELVGDYLPAVESIGWEVLHREK